jgi:hypothetical protein
MDRAGGIEVISPPFSVNRHWQQEIEQVFEAIGEYFDIWTTKHTSLHVHVSPGPVRGSKYTLAEAVNVAKSAYFWEKALVDLLPPDRKTSEYAEPNCQVFAASEYRKVESDGWAPVFRKIEAAAAEDVEDSQGCREWGSLVDKMGGREKYPRGPGTKHVSHNFEPLTCKVLGTIEFRRQAGVASAETAIFRALVGLTLHISARTYDFRSARSRKSHPSSDELIAELARCETLLPTTCVPQKSFVEWLRTCQRDYRRGGSFTEQEINDREAMLRPPSTRDIEAAPTGRPALALIAKSVATTSSTSSGRANATTSSSSSRHANATTSSSSSGRANATTSSSSSGRANATTSSSSSRRANNTNTLAVRPSRPVPR